MGIENIHAVRESLVKLHGLWTDSHTTNQTSISSNDIEKSGWTRHLKVIMAGTKLLINKMHSENRHCIIHCRYHPYTYFGLLIKSDGWDRTAQLSSLAQICLDSYFRTLEGFSILVQKEWLSFGHKFMDRTGRSLETSESSESFTFKSPFREISPIFLQFLECVNSLMQNNPASFGFKPSVLLLLYESLYSQKITTFQTNCEANKITGLEVWDLLGDSFRTTNSIDVKVLSPDKVEYWWDLYGNTSFGKVMIKKDNVNIQMESLDCATPDKSNQFDRGLDCGVLAGEEEEQVNVLVKNDMNHSNTHFKDQLSYGNIHDPKLKLDKFGIDILKDNRQHNTQKTHPNCEMEDNQEKESSIQNNSNTPVKNSSIDDDVFCAFDPLGVAQLLCEIKKL